MLCCNAAYVSSSSSSATRPSHFPLTRFNCNCVSEAFQAIFLFIHDDAIVNYFACWHDRICLATRPLLQNRFHLSERGGAYRDYFMRRIFYLCSKRKNTPESSIERKNNCVPFGLFPFCSFGSLECRFLVSSNLSIFKEKVKQCKCFARSFQIKALNLTLHFTASTS